MYVATAESQEGRDGDGGNDDEVEGNGRFLGVHWTQPCFKVGVSLDTLLYMLLNPGQSVIVIIIIIITLISWS